MNANVILLGGGGHAKVVADALAKAGDTIVAIALRPGEASGIAPRARRISDGDVMSVAAELGALLANGIGGIGDTSPRRELFDRFKAMGAKFRTVIHPSAVVADTAHIAEGAQIMAGAVIQPDAEIGANTIVNTRASIDHDCRIGAHVHIAPGVTLSGNVQVDDGAHVGTGACAIQGRRIGTRAVVGAGAVVLVDVAPGERFLGTGGTR